MHTVQPSPQTHSNDPRARAFGGSGQDEDTPGKLPEQPESMRT